MATAEAETGRPVSGCSEEWLMRPTCQSCRKISPPLAWTASVTSFQPSTCSSEWMPGAAGYPLPWREICVASEISNPPGVARWR